MGRVENKVAFITGAARGQGRSHAIRLAEEGADIIAVDICAPVSTIKYPLGTEDDLAQTVKAVEATGRRIVASVGDIRDLAAMQAAVAAGVAELGRLDIVCSNAGVLSYGPLADLDEETFDEMIAINLSGQWRAVKAAIPHLLKNSEGGSIIFTSSSAGLAGVPNVGHYSAAKHGLVGLARSLANELAPHMIRVNTIHPTTANTDMINNAQTYETFGVADQSEFEVISTAMSMLPRPWVEAADITNLVLFLASDESRYITGAAVPVDLGVTQKF